MVKGIIPGNPEDLAAAKGLDVDVYSLARVGQSEEISERGRIAVMYATLNHAIRVGKSITTIVTAGNPKRSDYSEAHGHYGRQGIHPYCSTIAEPSPQTIELAMSVMSGDATNEVGDAEYWDSPIAQDKNHLLDPDNNPSSAEIASRREASGLHKVVLPGVLTRFWVR